MQEVVGKVFHPTNFKQFCLMKSDLSLLWIVAMIGLTFLICNLVSHFSGEARYRKRRRKSYSPIVSKAHRPMVRFSVKTR